MGGRLAMSTKENHTKYDQSKSSSQNVVMKYALNTAPKNILSSKRKHQLLS